MDLRTDYVLVYEVYFHCTDGMETDAAECEGERALANSVHKGRITKQRTVIRIV